MPAEVLMMCCRAEVSARKSSALVALQILVAPIGGSAVGQFVV